MRKNIRFGVCCLAVLLLSGCNQEKLPEIIDESAISISKEGKISAYVVEEFDKEYYSISELTNMAVAEAGEYNTKNQKGEVPPIAVVKAEPVADGSNKVMIEYEFDSAETYMDYNEGELFYGTVSDAVQKQIKLDAVLYHIKDNTILSEEQLLANANKYYIIVTDEKAVIYCPKRVAYLSEGAVCNQDGSVDTKGADGLVYILLK